MKTIRMEIDLEYDSDTITGDDPEAVEWFYRDILIGERGLLVLHSNEIGYTIGNVKGIRILDNSV
jgi:hypothetical protein